MLNVALIGEAGSGKSVVAEHLQLTQGYARVSFAAPLKVAVGRLVFGPDLSEADAIAMVNANKSELRGLLQSFGVAMRNLIDPDYWVRAATAEAQKWNSQGRPVVVDDCRFINEADALKAAGFVFVRIVRPRWHRAKYGSPVMTAEQRQHVSEREQANVAADFALINGGTPEMLCSAVVKSLGLAATLREWPQDFTYTGDR